MCVGTEGGAGGAIICGLRTSSPLLGSPDSMIGGGSVMWCGPPVLERESSEFNGCRPVIRGLSVGVCPFMVTSVGVLMLT